MRQAITAERRYGTMLTIELLGWIVAALVCVVLYVLTAHWLAIVGVAVFAVGAAICAYHAAQLVLGNRTINAPRIGT